MLQPTINFDRLPDGINCESRYFVDLSTLDPEFGALVIDGMSGDKLHVQGSRTVESQGVLEAQASFESATGSTVGDTFTEISIAEDFHQITTNEAFRFGFMNSRRNRIGKFSMGRVGSLLVYRLADK